MKQFIYFLFEFLSNLRYKSYQPECSAGSGRSVEFQAELGPASGWTGKVKVPPSAARAAVGGSVGGNKWRQSGTYAHPVPGLGLSVIYTLPTWRQFTFLDGGNVADTKLFWAAVGVTGGSAGGRVRRQCRRHSSLRAAGVTSVAAILPKWRQLVGGRSSPSVARPKKRKFDRARGFDSGELENKKDTPHQKLKKLKYQPKPTPLMRGGGGIQGVTWRQCDKKCRQLPPNMAAVNKWWRQSAAHWRQWRHFHRAQAGPIGDFRWNPAVRMLEPSCHRHVSDRPIAAGWGLRVGTLAV
ncbi:hypothetical protein B0H11DRAFT_1905939 [Mycena galericulata]|nr:hypothetical protein B0H11DRAFT_1905939 [Mycena galericulata]